MIYLVRLRLKDSATVADLPTINKLIDEAISVIEQIQGVRAARAYNSFHGEIVFILDIENLATIDRALATREVGEAAARFRQWTTTVGPGDVMFDRGPYQALYAGR